MSESANRKDLAMTVVSGKGKVVVDFDTAILVATAEANAKTSRMAKGAVKSSVDALEKFLADLNTRGLVFQVKSSFDVGPRTIYRNSESVRDGYTAKYTLRFTTKAMDKVNEIFDELTEVGDNISVQSPLLIVECPEQHEKAAFGMAWSDVERRLNEQRSIIGTQYLHPCYWETREERVSHGKGGFSDDEGPVKVAGGKAHIIVNLTVWFA